MSISPDRPNPATPRLGSPTVAEDADGWCGAKVRRRTVLGACALAAPAALQARATAGVLLAQEAPPDIDPGGYLVSEKLDYRE